jgi:hypothetical protein
MQSTNGSFGNPSTQLLTMSVCQIASSDLKTGFSFHPRGEPQTTPDLLWSQTSGPKCHRSPRVYLDENSQGGWGLWFVSLCIAAVFVVDLYVGLPPLLSQSVGHRGTSPVKLTSHFPEAKTPTTLAFDERLTVSAARRRSFKALDRHASPSRGGWHSAEAESCFLPRSCFLAPSLPLFRVTLAAYLQC